MYKAHARSNTLASAASLYLSIETILRVPHFKKMAIGWRLTSMLGLTWGYRQIFNTYSSYKYQPLLGAYLRKYQNLITTDVWEIKDRKREYYEIDTSQYMNYTLEEADEHCHINTGPHPDGEHLDSTWLVELDKFLAGKENKLKEHPKYVNHQYEFIDKKFPTKEMAHDLIVAPAESK